MSQFEIILALLIGTTVYISWKGFRVPGFTEQFYFHIDRILIGKQWHRLVTSGFLHADWLHLSMNMVVLYLFGDALNYHLNPLYFVLLYFGSLLGGSLISLYFHRMHGDYSAYGASGAVSGVVFSYISFAPGGSITFIFIPGIDIWAWVFALAYLIYTLVALRRQADNIGHDAHLGGAITGILLTCVLHPEILATNWWFVLLMLLPFSAFMYIAHARPEFMIVNRWLPKSKDSGKRISAQQKRPAATRFISKEAELNALLEKVANEGIENLSATERKRLDELSKNV